MSENNSQNNEKNVTKVSDFYIKNQFLFLINKYIIIFMRFSNDFHFWFKRFEHKLQQNIEIKYFYFNKLFI